MKLGYMKNLVFNAYSKYILFYFDNFKIVELSWDISDQ